MAVISEWLNLLVRWIHVIAAIMWVGDSFLFVWLDSHLSKPSNRHTGDVSGELWMTHSGGFYEVVKHKSLGAVPPKLYWFMWESYTTWLSGITLLGIVYYSGNSVFLLDSSVSALTRTEAIAQSVSLLPAGYLFYELLWRTPLAKHQAAFAVVGFGLLIGLGYGLTHVFSGRAAFLHMGAIIGTTMAANVFFRIIPAQRHMIAATRAGTPVDTSYGARAKGRSIHNHYLTLPVLFTMLSNHFPSTYGSSMAWVVLACLFVFGFCLKYVMNARRESHPAVLGALVVSLGSFAFITAPRHEPLPGLERFAGAKPVSFATVQLITQTRCVTCHAAKPTTSMFNAPPQGVKLETPEQLHDLAERIYLLAVATKTMPLGNLTGATDDERALLGAWIAQGADVNAPGPAEVPSSVATPPKPTTAAPPEVAAKELFASRCVACHGEHGDGAGPAGVALPVKPRNYSDLAWQRAVTDEQLRAVIVGGGPAVGKSPLMPPNPDLATEPAVVNELIKTIRGFAPKEP